jgi:hypothetical protein
VVALDVDVKRTNGKASLEAWGGGGEGPVQETPSGGQHRLYRYLPGLSNFTNAGTHGSLDMRTDNGFIVVAPSVGGLGRYRWTVGGGPLDMPRKLADACIRASSAPRKAERESTEHHDLEAVDLAVLDLPSALAALIRDGKPQGQRSDAVAEVTRQLLELAIPESAIVSILTDSQFGISEKALDERRGDRESAAEWIKQYQLLPARKRLERTTNKEDCPYRADDGGGVRWLKPTRDGVTPIPLSNFTAQITADVVHDDGVEVRHHFEIDTVLAGRHRQLSITAGQFAGMTWVLDQLGAEAVVYPGFSVKDHLRVAIQQLSGKIHRRTVYAHLGWREIDGQQVYLHAGGAIGTIGTVPAVETDPGSGFEGYRLPPPPTGDDAVECVRASLALLDLAPDTVTVPLFAAVFRAVLGAADFSLHITGETGAGKSELVALFQQHWGAGLDSRHLPASWSSTGNALEGLAFIAKDAVLVVDDLAPDGTVYDVQRMHRDAARLLRAQGNHSGRQRMRSDATLRPTKPPRGMVISTGEETPTGHSVRARLLVLDLERGSLDWNAVTLAQNLAADGLLAGALSMYLSWLAPRITSIQRELRQRVAAKRGAVGSENAHQRTPNIIAELLLSLAQIGHVKSPVQLVSRMPRPRWCGVAWNAACAMRVHAPARHGGRTDWQSRGSSSSPKCIRWD